MRQTLRYLSGFFTQLKAYHSASYGQTGSGAPIPANASSMITLSLFLSAYLLSLIQNVFVTDVGAIDIPTKAAGYSPTQLGPHSFISPWLGHKPGSLLDYLERGESGLVASRV